MAAYMDGTEITIVYWRDIPAQVIVGRGRRALKRPLSERFEQAIDMAAMRSGAAGTDDYLAEWRKVQVAATGGDAPEDAAAIASARIEEAYDGRRLKTLIENGGREAA